MVASNSNRSLKIKVGATVQVKITTGGKAAWYKGVVVSNTVERVDILFEGKRRSTNYPVRELGTEVFRVFERDSQQMPAVMNSPFTPLKSCYRKDTRVPAPLQAESFKVAVHDRTMDRRANGKRKLLLVVVMQSLVRRGLGSKRAKQLKQDLKRRVQSAVVLQKYARRYLTPPFLADVEVLPAHLDVEQKKPSLELVRKQVDEAQKLLAAAKAGIMEVLHRADVPVELCVDPTTAALSKALGNDRPELDEYAAAAELEEYKETFEAIAKVTFTAGELAAVGLRLSTAAIAHYNDLSSTMHPSSTSAVNLTISAHTSSTPLVEVLKPTVSFIRGASGRSHHAASPPTAGDRSIDQAATFCIDLVQSQRYSRLVPRCLSYLGEVVSGLSQASVDSLRRNLPIVPSPQYTRKDARVKTAIAESVQSFGSVPFQAGVVALGSYSDNFGRSFSGERLEMVSVVERQIFVNQAFSELGGLLNDERIPMRQTGLEFDLNAWGADHDADALVEALVQYEIVNMGHLALMRHNTEPSAGHRTFGDRRLFLESGNVFGRDYQAVRSDGVVVISERGGEEAPSGDGQNAWERNTMRLLRQRTGEFSSGVLLDALTLEAYNAASSRDISLVLSGDGAPTAYLFNQQKRVHWHLWKKLAKARLLPEQGLSRLPLIPPDDDDTIALFSMSTEQKAATKALHQHIADPHDPTKRIANPLWLKTRVGRATASNASALIGASARTTSPDEAAALLAGARESAEATGRDTWGHARGAIASMICPKPWGGNAYTALGNAKEDEAEDSTQAQITTCLGQKPTMVTSGSHVMLNYEFILASLDSEVQMTGEHAGRSGVLEIKTAAAEAFAYWKNVDSYVPKYPHFGLHEQPPGSPSWDCIVDGKLQAAPISWGNKGPAKWAYYVQMTVQTLVMNSNGAGYSQIWFAIWHPTSTQVFTCAYNKIWAERVVLPLLQAAWTSEFIPSARDFQEQYPAGIPLEDRTRIIDEGDENDGGNDDVLSDEEEEVDLRRTKEEVAVPTEAAALSDEIIALHMSGDVSIIPGQLHESQVNSETTFSIFRDELLAVLTCVPGLQLFAKTSEKRRSFLLDGGSLNKSNVFIERLVCPSVALFFIRMYKHATGDARRPGAFVSDLRDWVACACEKYAVLRRLDELLKKGTIDRAHRVAQKVGDLYAMHDSLVDIESEYWAADGRKIYVDQALSSKVQNATASTSSLVTLLDAGVIDMGSHKQAGDHMVESIHDRYANAAPKARLDQHGWKLKIEALSSTGSEPGGALHSFGLAAPGVTSGAFGDRTIDLPNVLVLAADLESMFPEALPADFSSINQGRLPKWRDLRGNMREAGDLISIGGSDLELHALDAPRVGRVQLARRLRYGFFGHNPINPPPSEGMCGDEDVEPKNSDPRVVLGGTNKLISKVIHTAKEVKEMKATVAARLSAGTSDGVVLAFKGETNLLRARVKKLQHSPDRPPESRGVALLDKPFNKGTKTDVAETYLAFKTTHPQYFGSLLNAESPAAPPPESVLGQLHRHPTSATRGEAARQLVRDKKVFTTGRRDLRPQDRLDFDEIGTASPEATFVAFLAAGSVTTGTSNLLVNAASAGGGKNCILNDSTLDSDVVAMRLFSRENERWSTDKRRAETKADQLRKGVGGRKEKELLRVLRRRVSMRPQPHADGKSPASFWTPEACPPPAAVLECKAFVELHAQTAAASSSRSGRGGRAPRKDGVYETYTMKELVAASVEAGIRPASARATMIKRLGDPGKAPKAFDRNITSTWTVPELRAHLANHGRASTAARPGLLLSIANLSACPLVVTEGYFVGFTVERLRTELSGRGESQTGTHAELLLRMQAFEVGRSGAPTPAAAGGKGPGREAAVVTGAGKKSTKAGKAAGGGRGGGLSVKDMRAALRGLGLTSSGLKAELESRLRGSMHAEACAPESPAPALLQHEI